MDDDDEKSNTCSPPSTLAVGVRGGSFLFLGKVGVVWLVSRTKGRPIVVEEGVAAGVTTAEDGPAPVTLWLL